MPELPEVETTVRGIAPHLVDRTITSVIVRNARLRWPVPTTLERQVLEQPVLSVRRRAKYILIELPHGHLMLHLGMSGSLRVTPTDEPPARHDHVELEIEGGQRLRLHDPRRFGCVLWVEGDPNDHPLLRHLGMEPLEEDFGGGYLHRVARHRKVAVKHFIMDSRVVVGIGNIYASEALHFAGIHPCRAARRISLTRYGRLVTSIRKTLQDSIDAGGTTLRDFVDGTGAPGYFSRSLKVYGREGEPCFECGQPIARRVLGGRSTYYCKRCQT